MPADQPINLNKARKARAKVQKRAQADQNAHAFGRSKAERAADKALTDRMRDQLDAHRRDKPKT